MIFQQWLRPDRIRALLGLWNGGVRQSSERHELKSSGSDDQQPLPAQAFCHGTDQEAAQLARFFQRPGTLGGSPAVRERGVNVARQRLEVLAGGELEPLD